MHQSPAGGTHPARVRILDCARGIALLLMLVSHAMQLFPGGAQHDAWLQVSAILLLTKAATPLFVLVFGMTMVFVHYGRLSTPDGFSVVRQRMWRRALFAFLSFELLVIVVETTENTPFPAIVERMLYVRPGNWIEVLNFYIVVLLIGPWLLRWWRGASIAPRVLIIPTLYGLGALLAEIPVSPYLFELKNILVGYQQLNTHIGLDAFPVLQLSSFFLAGLIIGEYLFKQPQQESNRFRTLFWFTGLFIVAGLMTSFIVTGDTVREYFGNMATDRYRFPPRLPYVLFALSCALGTMLTCLWFVQVRNSHWSIFHMFDLLGRHSLLTFNLQYVLLFAVYGLALDMLHQQSFLASLLNTGAIIAVCVATVWVWERWRRRQVGPASPILP